MRLADELAAFAGSKLDFGGAGLTITKSIKSAQRFELSDEVRDACVQVCHSKPSSMRVALPLARLPYPRVWVEWVTLPSDDPMRPRRVGFLAEALLPKGTMYIVTWAWTHKGLPVTVCPAGMMVSLEANRDKIIRMFETFEPGSELDKQIQQAFGPRDTANAKKFMLDWLYAGDEGKYVEQIKKYKNLRWEHLSDEEARAALELQANFAPIESPHCHRMLDILNCISPAEKERLSSTTAAAMPALSKMDLQRATA
jgi:hypothetical protein